MEYEQSALDWDHIEHHLDTLTLLLSILNLNLK